MAGNCYRKTYLDRKACLSTKRNSTGCKKKLQNVSHLFAPGFQMQFKSLAFASCPFRGSLTHQSLEALENSHGNLLAKNDSYVSCHSITLHLFSPWPSFVPWSKGILSKNNCPLVTKENVKNSWNVDNEIKLLADADCFIKEHVEVQTIR